MATAPAPTEKKTPPPPAKTGGSTPPAPAPAGTPKPPTLAMQAKSFVDIVEAKISELVKNGQLDMPKDYSVDNALKAAWLVLQAAEDKEGNKALEVCTRDSIANSLLDMIVQGLNVGKKQGYFIVYGKTLTFQRSYFGSMAVAQMVQPKIADFAYAVVYEDDIFKYGIQNGRKAVVQHEQELKNIDKRKIVAAYCTVFDTAGVPIKTEIMTFDEILQSWKQSKAKPFDDNGNLKESSTHGKFTADMALKTVINKACKTIINSSSDNALLLERINRNEDLADAAAAQAEITEHANVGEVLEITENAGKTAEGGPETDSPAEPVCVCDEMLRDGLAEFDCPVHGRFKDGKFTKIAEKSKRGPGF